jgi:hypothetical protein
MLKTIKKKRVKQGRNIKRYIANNLSAKERKLEIATYMRGGKY